MFGPDFIVNPHGAYGRLREVTPYSGPISFATAPGW